jgi:replicative DNA helicase
VALNIPLELLEPRLRDYHEKRAQEHLERSYREFFREGQSLLDEGKINELVDYIEEKLLSFRTKVSRSVIEPYSLKSLQEDITQTGEGIKTGYQSLDQLVVIPRGAITIVAARSSIVRTAFLLNLFINMIRLYPERAFFFFSYEKSKKQIGLMLLNILSGVVLDERNNLIRLENYLEVKDMGNQEIEKGKAEFEGLTESRRLWIMDEPYFLDDLTDTLSYLKERYNVGAVIIDNIQKVQLMGNHQTRQIGLQQITGRILETAKTLSLPVILGAQLGEAKENKDRLKLDLKEIADIEQDADLVMGLYHKDIDTIQEDYRHEEVQTVDLDLIILKNRNAIIDERTTLIFNRPILTIRDKHKGA